MGRREMLDLLKGQLVFAVHGAGGKGPLFHAGVDHVPEAGEAEAVV